MTNRSFVVTGATAVIAAFLFPGWSATAQTSTPSSATAPSTDRQTPPPASPHEEYIHASPAEALRAVLEVIAANPNPDFGAVRHKLEHLVQNSGSNTNILTKIAFLSGQCPAKDRRPHSNTMKIVCTPGTSFRNISIPIEGYTSVSGRAVRMSPDDNANQQYRFGSLLADAETAHVHVEVAFAPPPLPGIADGNPGLVLPEREYLIGKNGLSTATVSVGLFSDTQNANNPVYDITVDFYQ